jgi:hypothetical protein
MSSRLIALFAVIAGFGVLTALALVDVGYFGILEPHFRSWGGAQVFADLSILAVLGCVWMISDGRAQGINPWPFVVGTVLMGSFGVLFYLAWRELRHGPRVGSAVSARAARVT